MLSGSRLAAADFEIGPQDAYADSPSSSAGMGIPAPAVPLALEVGDVPTAYALKKYGLRTDFKFHDGGGILSKATLGLFPRFTLGGAAELRNFIGSGDLRMSRDDAQLLARLQVLTEDEAIPALALGWDGPAYERGEAKGLYIAVSKEVPTSFAFLQFHGGINSANVETFVGSRDLRASFALNTAISNVALFTGVDEVLHPLGSRWNAGFSVSFAPITLGLELRDLASARPNTPVSRLLRISWAGRF
jgi:hypothetical protein